MHFKPMTFHDTYKQVTKYCGCHGIWPVLKIIHLISSLLYTFSHIKNSLDSALSIKLKKYLIYRREIKLHYCKQGKLKF